jgi:hypothetical protein
LGATLFSDRKVFGRNGRKNQCIRILIFHGFSGGLKKAEGDPQMKMKDRVSRGAGMCFCAEYGEA